MDARWLGWFESSVCGERREVRVVLRPGLLSERQAHSFGPYFPRWGSMSERIGQTYRASCSRNGQHSSLSPTTTPFCHIARHRTDGVRSYR